MKFQDWLNLWWDPEVDVDSKDVNNFRKRNYLHYRDETISCRVLEKEKKDAVSNCGKVSPQLANFVRLMLQDDENVVELYRSEFRVMFDEDYDRMVGMEAHLDKKEREKLTPHQSFLVSQLIRYMDRKEIRDSLPEVVSTKINGYEKEIFILRCAKCFSAPAVTLRVGVRLLGVHKFSSQERIELMDLL